MTTSGEFNSSNSLSAPPTLSGTSPGFEGVNDGSGFESRPWKRQRTDDQIDPVYDYSYEEEEAARTLVMLAISGGGHCCSSSAINPRSELIVFSTKSTPSTPANKEGEKSRDDKISPPTILRLKLPPKNGQQDKTYKCSECDVAFLSYQALGGHKTRHRIKPPTTATSAAVTEFNFMSGPNPSGRLHECSICHKTFNTGQALGGHMGKHSNPFKTTVPTLSDSSRCTNSEVITHSTEIGIGRPRIDLNLPPSPEEEQVQTQTPGSLFLKVATFACHGDCSHE